MKPPFGGKAFGFARVSTEDQAVGGISLGLQAAAIRAYCEQESLELVRLWEVAETASFHDQRAEFQGMLKDFSKSKDIRHLVFYKVDRSNRNFWDHARLADLVLTHGKHMHAALDHFHLHPEATPSEWDRFDMMGLFARSETRHLSARVKACIGQQTAQGYWSYKAPPGYRKVSRAGIEIDPVQGPLFRQILEAAATGNFSLDVLMKEAGRLGIICHKKPISRSALHRWLTDPIFAGPFYSKGQLVTCYQHEPLISWETHERILEHLSDRRSVEKKPIREPQNLAGIFVCGRCGGQISFYRVKGRYSYGFCSSCKRSKRQQQHSEERKVLDQLGGVVTSCAITPDVGVLLRSWLEEERGKQVQRTQAQAGALEARLESLRKKLLRAFGALSEGTVDDETYRAQTAAWRQEKETLEIELRSLARGEYREKWDQAAQAFQLAQGAAILWESATPREKAKLAKTVCSNLSLTDGTLGYSLAFPFDALAKGNGGNDWRRGWESWAYCLTAKITNTFQPLARRPSPCTVN